LIFNHHVASGSSLLSFRLPAYWTLGEILILAHSQYPDLTDLYSLCYLS